MRTSRVNVIFWFESQKSFVFSTRHLAAAIFKINHSEWYSIDTERNNFFVKSKIKIIEHLAQQHKKKKKKKCESKIGTNHKIYRLIVSNSNGWSGNRMEGEERS